MDEAVIVGVFESLQLNFLLFQLDQDSLGLFHLLLDLSLLFSFRLS